MSAANVLAMIKEQEVKFVDLRFTDTKGKEQHVSIPARITSYNVCYTKLLRPFRETGSA